MTSLNNDQALDRIARDDAPPDDTVYLTRRSGLRGCYHADADCPWGCEDTRELTRVEAQEQRRPPCSYCVLDDYNQGEWSEQRCPFCDALIKSLPTHLEHYCPEAP